MQHTREATESREVATVARWIVQGVKRTAYEHGLIADPATGSLFTDCSGFVSFLLEGIAPEHYGAIPRQTDHAYPRAFEFFDYFASRAADATRAWRRIPRLFDAAEGDLVAWRAPHLRADQDSGHVFVVAEAPALVTAGVWAVRVYDSSDVPHFDDSRGHSGAFASGVGTGTILLHVDALGRAIGFQFGPDDALHEAPIAIARLEPIHPRLDGSAEE